ncbi:F0F1 ATP synthase subunit B [Shouchella lonarensis]|uniref:ATP synthase subunit b n=1 Tax=Shouchella lonarensis TaxID=1464122 RepID=A0A1G6GX90_9BACI|nr:F0F1 ATP synthase subunit B [Shouchella lonarensis]SDB86571.1 ATP synthase F0 subcomplex B subunit [Shouchella lonarensis]
MPFDIAWGTIVYQLVGFLVLIALLNKFALKPMLGIMQNRQDMINEQMDSAKRNQEEAEKLVAAQQEELKKARVEARELIENAKKAGEQQGKQMVEEARAEAARIHAQALAEIQNEKEQAVAALRAQVSSLSVLIASKVIEKELDAKEQDKLVQTYLKQVGEEL